MRAAAVLPLLGLIACSGSQVAKNEQAIACDGTDIPIYSNRFVPQAGASGVATGGEAASGTISSDNPSSSGAPVQPTDGSPLTAMTVTCGAASCAPGQVAIEAPPMVAPGGGVGATGGAPSASGAAGDSAGPSAPPQLMPAGTLLCADPPPTCPPGQSPQFTAKQTWECTDCSLVVTYGGAYGNYRRCVNAPTIDCPMGQVPTWVFEDEKWECKDTCDNGQYDQHKINGMLVCVPC
jgi:hypothetical protein